MRMNAKYLLVLCAFFLACNKGELLVFEPDELGTDQDEFVVEADAGSLSIQLYSNASGSIRSTGSWLTPAASTFRSDSKIQFDYTANTGFPRHSMVYFETDTRRDTVKICQKGTVEEVFHLKTTAKIVYNGTGTATVVPLDVNVPVSEITCEVRYMNDRDWVHDCEVTSEGIRFTLDDNPDPVQARRAVVALFYTDGWGIEREEKLTVVQARSDNRIGTVFTAEQLRSLATVSGYKLPDDAYFEGFIVGTTEGGNAGALEVGDYRTGNGVVEYELDECTNYLESVDGKYGFRIVTDTPLENDFIRDTKIGLMLSGAKVRKSATEPVCYEISGVSSFNLITASDEPAPVKEKSIEDITDDDIFTSVVLKDCEIPMRKGPFTPINEGYGNLCSYNFFAKYPQLVRDRKGGSIYMFINVTCPYRRDGNPMPNGSGDIRCVVVNEKYKSFGDVGRYQIRPLTREDIALKEDFKDSFSALISEFRWTRQPGENESTTLPGAILATAGNGEMTHTYSGYTSGGVRFGNFSPSYFYLGPCGTSKKKHISNGAGLILDDGTEYKPWEGDEANQNTDGKGWIATGCRISWSNKYWWNSSAGEGYAYLVKFSTAGVSSDFVSMQFAMYNNSQNLRSPRYWKAQYSFDAENWTDVGEFTVNDVAIWAMRCDWQTLGTQVFDFPLPTSILGKDDVYIRLMPRINKAAQKTDDGYDNSTIANDSGYNTMDYFAIRYNK